MQLKYLNKFPTTIVATIIFINGFMTILLALMPSVLSKVPDFYQTSQVLEYAYYKQASLILTIILGLILLNLGLGLYKKQRNAWRCTIVLLIILILGDVYPKIKFIQLSLGIISLAVLLIYHKQFRIVKNDIKKHSVIAWVSIIIALLYGALGCYFLRSQFHGIRTPIDALYYTLVTYSTVGYGDIVPLTSDAKIFVMTMILVGIGSFVTVISMLIGPILQEKLKKVSDMVEHMNYLKHHAILCGMNSMTLELAQLYQSKKIDVLMIVSTQQQQIDMEQIGYHALVGDVTDKKTLMQAGLSSAQYCVCAVGDDAKNILIVMKVAKLLSKVSKKNKVTLVTIIDDPENASIAKTSGAHEVIVPSALVGQYLFPKDIKDSVV